jgi:hypothetical protein
MSTVRKIEGCTTKEGQFFRIPPDAPGTTPATLIIDGKAWTDDEVRAMVKEVHDYLAKQWDSDAADGMMKIVAKHSIQLP